MLEVEILLALARLNPYPYSRVTSIQGYSVFLHSRKAGQRRDVECAAHGEKQSYTQRQRADVNLEMLNRYLLAVVGWWN